MPLTQTPSTVTAYRRHRWSLVPVREINHKAYASKILTQVARPALGIEPRAIHKQPLKPAMYCVKPQRQGSYLVALGPITSHQLRLNQHCLQRKCRPKNQLFFIMWFMVIFPEITEKICIKERHSTCRNSTCETLCCHLNNSGLFVTIFVLLHACTECIVCQKSTTPWHVGKVQQHPGILVKYYITLACW